MVTSADGPITSFTALNTIITNLVVLAEYFEGRSSSSISSHTTGSGELPAVFEMITSIMSGEVGQLDMEELERKHNAIALGTDSIDDLRTGACIEAVINCSEFGASEKRATILRYVEVSSADL